MSVNQEQSIFVLSYWEYVRAACVNVPFSKLKEYLKVNAPHVRHYVTEASGTDNNNNNKTHFITENYFITKYTTFVITYLFNYLKIT